MLSKVMAILLASLMALTYGHIGGHVPFQDFQDLKPQKFCGPLLANTLALVCYPDNGGIGKRSNYNSVYKMLMPSLYKEQENQYWAWLSSEKSQESRFSISWETFRRCRG